MDAASGAAIPTAIELNTSPALRETHDSKEPDSSPNSEPLTPLLIESDQAPIMEFTAADIFQHSPFGDILKTLKSVSLSGEPWPDYGQQGWDTDYEEIQSPPTTHFVATVDDLTDISTSTPKTSTVWTPMKETMKNQRLLGPGTPPRHMTYRWWTHQKMTTRSGRTHQRLVPSKSSQSGDTRVAPNPTSTETQP